MARGRQFLGVVVGRVLVLLRVWFVAKPHLEFLLLVVLTLRGLELLLLLKIHLVLLQLLLEYVVLRRH